jgi:hypothetical protein
MLRFTTVRVGALQSQHSWALSNDVHDWLLGGLSCQGADGRQMSGWNNLNPQPNNSWVLRISITIKSNKCCKSELPDGLFSGQIPRFSFFAAEIYERGTSWLNVKKNLNFYTGTYKYSSINWVMGLFLILFCSRTFLGYLATLLQIMGGSSVIIDRHW